MSIKKQQEAFKQRILEFIEEPSNFKKVESSNIDSYAWMPDIPSGVYQITPATVGTLFIKFKSKNPKNSLYAYMGITQELLTQMESADSVGKFFQANIRDNYPTFKF